MSDDADERDGEGEDRPRRRLRVLSLLQGIDGHPRLLDAARFLRGRMPGDRDLGDPLSLAGTEAPQLIGQRLAAFGAARPSALREVGFGALQAFQAFSEANGRGHGDRELTIVFTDIADFSSWTLDAGDTMALELLRRVGKAIEPPITSHGGRIVKRLGDGLMAVFDDPVEAVAAALEAQRAMDQVDVGGHRPRLRAGVHLGRPRKLGGDYFGVDVNVAARVAAAAGPGEVLVSGTIEKRLDDRRLAARRRWRFRAKGAPKDLKVYTASTD